MIIKDRPQRTSRVGSRLLLLCFSATPWFERPGLFLGLFFSCTRSVACTFALMRYGTYFVRFQRTLHIFRLPVPGIIFLSLHLVSSWVRKTGLLTFVLDPGDFVLRLGKDSSEGSPRALVVLPGEDGILHLVDAALPLTIMEVIRVLYKGKNNSDFVFWMGAKCAEDV